jgi:hypothetical protein
LFLLAAEAAIALKRITADKATVFKNTFVLMVLYVFKLSLTIFYQYVIEFAAKVRI